MTDWQPINRADAREAARRGLRVLHVASGFVIHPEDTQKALSAPESVQLDVAKPLIEAMEVEHGDEEE